MIKTENMAKIKADYKKLKLKKAEKQKSKQPQKLVNMFSNEFLFDEEDDNENMCLFCHL